MRFATVSVIFLLVLALAVPAAAQTNARPFQLDAQVQPARAPLGGPVEFTLTVTNVSTQPASFGVDGCPVHYTIYGPASADKGFTPEWACAEFWRRITVDPGQSVSFGPQDAAGLRLDPRDYPLAPGMHTAVFWVPDIGRDAQAKIQFFVGNPAPDQAYLAGKFTGRDGAPVWNGQIILHGAGPDSVGPPDSTHVPTGETYRVLVGQYGYWYVGGIHPNVYRIEGVTPDGSRVFYPGVPDPDQAQPVPVGPGEFRHGLDLSFQTAPPPPPPPPPDDKGHILGAVFEDSNTDGVPVPIANAMVRAVPVASDPTLPPGANGAAPDPFGYFAFSQDDGTFRIDAPPGNYILFASLAGYRYRYWHGKDTWNAADLVTVFPPGTGAPDVLHSLFLRPDLLGDPSVVRGLILGRNPQSDVPPHPVPGAVVRLLPLAGGFERALLQTKTDADGAYEITVPPETPYYVQASADGYSPGFHGPDPNLPTGVDVVPAHATEHVDITLQGPPPPPPDRSHIHGTVYEDSFTDGIPAPIVNTVVRAIPVGSDAFPDSIPPDPNGTFPSPLGYFALSGPDGAFRIDCPPGNYILLGAHEGYRYRYWFSKDTWEEAETVLVFPPGSEAPDVAHDLYLWPDLHGDPSTVRGQVRGRQPLANEPPYPVAGALVRFFPLGGGIQKALLLQAQTDADGFYEIVVPSETPYFVQVSADGHRPGFYGPDPNFPAGVDVVPAHATEHVDVTLWTEPGPYPGDGSIFGFVFEPDPACDRAAGCLVPAVGATVRVEAAYPTFAPYVRTTVVGRDGSFRVDGLTADDQGTLSYYVSAMRRNSEAFYHPGGVPFDRAVPLPVFTGKVADAGRIVLGGGVKPPGAGVLGGRLVDSADHGVPHGLVKLFLDPDNPAGPVLTVHTDAEGWFGFNNLPLGKGFLLAGADEGFIPSYYPGVAFWRNATRVQAAGPNVRMAPFTWTLNRQAPGVYLQAGLVQVAEGAVADSGQVDPDTGDPAVLALAYHRRNVPDALFFVVNALAASPVDIPVAGGFTGDNGAAILTELPEGSYIAMADRPGFQTEVFRDASGAPRPITLNATTPAVLAEIDLMPVGQTAPPAGDLAPGMVSGLRNAPNPFSPETVIRFTLSEPAQVCVEVFDFQGRLVRTLLTRQQREAGEQVVPWDGTDERGLTVPAGVYFYRVQAGAEVISRKMVLLPR